MSQNNQIKMDVVQGQQEKKAIGKFPLVVSFSRLAPITRQIHELTTTPTPIDVLPDDFTGRNMDFPRRIEVVDTSSGFVNEGVVVTFTGRDAKGKEIVESVTIPSAGSSVRTKNAFLYVAKIHADEVIDDEISITLSNSFGFALDLGFIVFNALSQSNGNNQNNGEVIPADATYDDDGNDVPVFTIDEEYDVITINNIAIINTNGVHLSFFFA